MTSTEYNTFINTDYNTYINQLTPIAYNVSYNALVSAPSSAAKAALIDYPAYLFFGVENAEYKTAVAFTTYEIRATINKTFREYFELTENDITENLAVGIAAGSTGGAFRYYATGQNPLIGALNNAAYEICNNFKTCSDNKLINGAFIVAIESLDAAAQAYLKFQDGDVPGAVMSALYGGAKVGMAVHASIHSIYVPVSEFIPTDIQTIETFFIGSNATDSNAINTEL